MKRLISITTLGLLLSFSNISLAETKPQALELWNVLKVVHESNPEILAAREELKAKQELYPQASAGWKPSIRTSAELLTTDIDSSNFSTGTGATTKDFTASIDQPIWRGGRTFAETKRAKKLIKAAEKVLDQTEQDLMLRASLAYIDLLRDAKIWNLYKENVSILKNELTAAEEKYHLGAITITGVHQARSRHQRALSNLTSALSTLKTSESKFIEITDLRPKGLKNPNIEFNFPGDIEKMILISEQNSAILKIAEYQYQATEHNIDSVFRELFPQISAFAYINKQYDPQPGIVDQSRTDALGLRATLSLYEGGATRSRVREAKRLNKKQRYEIDTIKRSIKQEVTDNWQSYIATQNIMQNRAKEIDSAQLALEGIREEVRAGQRDIIDILDADEILINAKINLARAKRDEMASRYTLAKSLGLLNLEALSTQQRF